MAEVTKGDLSRERNEKGAVELEEPIIKGKKCRRKTKEKRESAQRL